MTEADPEFTFLYIYLLSGERGQNILDKARFVKLISRMGKASREIGGAL